MFWLPLPACADASSLRMAGLRESAQPGEADSMGLVQRA